MRFGWFVQVCGLALAISACSADSPRFDHLYYTDVSSAPGKVSLRPLEIQIAQGLAVRATVQVIGTDGSPMARPDFRSSDSTVFGADPGPSPGEFVFYGVAAGSAELDVYSNGRYETSVPVDVLAP